MTVSALLREKQVRVRMALTEQILLFPRSYGDMCLSEYVLPSGTAAFCGLRREHEDDCYQVNRAFRFHGSLHDDALLDDLTWIGARVSHHDVRNCDNRTCIILTAPEGWGCQAAWLIHRMGAVFLGEAEPGWVEWFK